MQLTEEAEKVKDCIKLLLQGDEIIDETMMDALEDMQEAADILQTASRGFLKKQFMKQSEYESAVAELDILISGTILQLQHTYENEDKCMSSCDTWMEQLFRLHGEKETLKCDMRKLGYI
jgi:vacuolar-type H+-ATPase catalytic subunit A/Vma1